MQPRPLLTEAQRTPRVAKAMADFQQDTVEQVRATVQREAVVVVGMGGNPYVRKVRQLLDEAGIAFTYLEYGNYFSQWKPRLAIKLWSGWPTFPQVFVRGVLVGGFNDTRDALQDGSLKKLLG